MRYGIIWATGWLTVDSDGEPVDEPEGGRCLCDTDDLDMAFYLLSLWVPLAGHLYGPGVVTITDRAHQGQRIAALHGTAAPNLAA